MAQAHAAIVASAARRFDRVNTSVQKELISWMHSLS